MILLHLENQPARSVESSLCRRRNLRISTSESYPPFPHGKFSTFPTYPPRFPKVPHRLSPANFHAALLFHCEAPRHFANSIHHSGSLNQSETRKASSGPAKKRSSRKIAKWKQRAGGCESEKRGSSDPSVSGKQTSEVSWLKPGICACIFTDQGGVRACWQRHMRRPRLSTWRQYLFLFVFQFVPRKRKGPVPLATGPSVSDAVPRLKHL